MAVEELRAHCAAHPSLLLDVREAWEVALAVIRIDGAQWLDIPMNQLPARLAALDPQRLRGNRVYLPPWRAKCTGGRISRPAWIRVGL